MKKRFNSTFIIMLAIMAAFCVAEFTGAFSSEVYAASGVKPVTNVAGIYYGSPEADEDSNIVVSFSHQGKCDHYQIVVLKDDKPYGNYTAKKDTVRLNKLDGPGKYEFTIYAVNKNGKRSSGASTTVYAGIDGPKSEYSKYVGSDDFNLGVKSDAEIAYFSNNEEVLSVDDNGNVSVHKPGKATVSVVVLPDLNHKMISKKINVSVNELGIPTLEADGHCNNSTLFWDKVDGAEGYIISEHNLSSDKTEEYVIDDADKTLTVLEGKTAGTEYEYSIQSYSKSESGKEFKSSESKPVEVTITSPYIGQATYGESGAGHNKAGDQTGHEVSTSRWHYSSGASPFHWTYVIRCKDTRKALAMADAMENACKNNAVGYDNATSADRTSFYRQAMACDGDTSKITTPCETACSQCVSACVNCAGIPLKADVNSQMLSNALRASGQFEFYNCSGSTSNLCRGDIIISLGKKKHSAMVL